MGATAGDRSAQHMPAMSDSVTTRRVVVTNPQGMHARPAEMFAKLALQFDAAIEVAREDHAVDGKSILNLLTLGAAQGVVLTLTARGDDADDAIAALVDLVENDFAVDETISRDRSG